ncbi:MAG TPA: hypothetical protein VFQ48_06825 [Pseudonocardiaceae bacterium]|nr:hypothetical protein [Pseudonocardiaceae bacterium]
MSRELSLAQHIRTLDRDQICARSARLIRDYERLLDSHESIVKWTMLGLMTRVAIGRLLRDAGTWSSAYDDEPDR